MSICSFYGYSGDEDLDFEMVGCLFKILEYLIVERDVKLFCTTSETKFERYCEYIIELIKKEHKDIKLIKFEKKYGRDKDFDSPYDALYHYQSISSKKRRKFMVFISDYILFDKIIRDKTIEMMLSESIYNVLSNKELLTHIISLERVYKKMQD